MDFFEIDLLQKSESPGNRHPGESRNLFEKNPSWLLSVLRVFVMRFFNTTHTTGFEGKASTFVVVVVTVVVQFFLKIFSPQRTEEQRRRHEDSRV